MNRTNFFGTVSFNVCSTFTEEENGLRMRWKRRITRYFVAYCPLLYCRGRGTDSGVELRAALQSDRLTVRNLFNYLLHVPWALFAMLKDNESAQVKLLSVSKRRAPENLVKVFSVSCRFVTADDVNVPAILGRRARDKVEGTFVLWSTANATHQLVKNYTRLLS